MATTTTRRKPHRSTPAGAASVPAGRRLTSSGTALLPAGRQWLLSDPGSGYHAEGPEHTGTPDEPTPHQPADLAGLLDTAAQLLGEAARCELAHVETEVLTGALDTLRRLEATVAAARARIVRACETRRLAQADGAANMTAWLRDRQRLSGRDAKQAVELGRDLDRLPRTAQALTDGTIGTEQATQIGRAARRGTLGDPGDIEATLLPTATRSTPEQLRDEVRRREHAADGDRLLRDEQAARARRSLRTWRRDDGLYAGTYLLDPVSGETVETFLRAFTQPDPSDTPIEHRRSPEQRAADALTQGAMAALDAGAAPRNGGERPHISVIVPYETLVDRIADGTHTPEIPAEGANTGPISTAALHRLACDAGIVRIITRGPTQVLDLGRTERNWTGSQRRAIVAIDGGCRFPGCDRPAAWTHIHHVQPWDDDGPTDIDNGTLLCVLHHHLVHEGGWKLTIDPDTRTVAVVSPDRRTRRTSHPRGAATRTHTATRRRRRRRNHRGDDGNAGPGRQRRS